MKEIGAPMNTQTCDSYQSPKGLDEIQNNIDPKVATQSKDERIPIGVNRILGRQTKYIIL